MHISSRLHLSSLFKRDSYERNVILSTYIHYLLTVPNHIAESATAAGGVSGDAAAAAAAANGGDARADMNGSGDHSYYATMTRFVV